MVMEGLKNKVTSEQRVEGSETAIQVSEGRVFQTEEIFSAEALRLEVFSILLGRAHLYPCLFLYRNDYAYVIVS